MPSGRTRRTAWPKAADAVESELTPDQGRSRDHVGVDAAVPGGGDERPRRGDGVTRPRVDDVVDARGFLPSSVGRRERSWPARRGGSRRPGPRRPPGSTTRGRSRRPNRRGAGGPATATSPAQADQRRTVDLRGRCAPRRGRRPGPWPSTRGRAGRLGGCARCGTRDGDARGRIPPPGRGPAARRAGAEPGPPEGHGRSRVRRSRCRPWGRPHPAVRRATPQATSRAS